MRKTVIAGNWKMYKTLPEVNSFAQAFLKDVSAPAQCEILICPPAVYLHHLAGLFAGSPVKLGAQNVYWEDQGAFTGEISAPMLVSLGVSHVITGHSERRQFFGETDATVNKRLLAALRHGLTPILCVGESLAERESGNTFAVIQTQLEGGLATLSADEAKRVIVAYEPVWAIGTGKTATPEIAQEVHAFIRARLQALYDTALAQSIPIQYGGSVKPENIDVLMAQKDIDGALVGGASLEAASFARIVQFRG